MSHALRILGWREWAELPALGLPPLIVKVDTGAESSALHAADVERFHRRTQPWLRFYVNLAAGQSPYYRCEAPHAGERLVRSSSGHSTVRPLIMAEIVLMNEAWPIEISLTDREAMQHRMLLGRNAIAGRFLVDPQRSFLGGEEAS